MSVATHSGVRSGEPTSPARHVTFQEWINGRQIASLGTNAGAPALPFQKWRHFKEAFAPELIHRAVRESPIAVKRCLDPFGGSGTTALACQFLGVRPSTIEVNPFLADLVEAKLSTYDADSLAKSLGSVLRRFRRSRTAPRVLFDDGPATLVEPGVKGRWIFDREVAVRIGRLLDAIAELTNESHVRLFRVLLGGTLIGMSNVIVSGKGRRYRQNWAERERDTSIVERTFSESVQRAIAEIHQYAKRACSDYDVYRGDCRSILADGIPCDLAVFSPPYPNSFDYTDVYNVELWTLGYLADSSANKCLRVSTLCSHVQIARDFPLQPSGSHKLDRALNRLRQQQDELWDHRIPQMVAGYFADMSLVLKGISESIARRGLVWMVLGDSRYADVRIRTASILAELAKDAGWKLQAFEPCRSMRASAQQGGRRELAETLLVLQRQ
jgi:hypothetical protein